MNLNPDLRPPQAPGKQPSRLKKAIQVPSRTEKNHCGSSLSVLASISGIEARDGVHPGRVGHDIDSNGGRQACRLASRRETSSVPSYGFPRPGIVPGDSRGPYCPLRSEFTSQFYIFREVVMAPQSPRDR